MPNPWVRIVTGKEARGDYKARGDGEAPWQKSTGSANVQTPAQGNRSGRRQLPREWAESDFATSLEARLLASEFAKVVEARTANDAVLHDFNLVDVGAMGRKYTFNTDAEAYFADGEGRTKTSAAAANDNALVNLDALFLALDDLIVDANRVTDAHGGNVVSELGSFNLCDFGMGEHGHCFLKRGGRHYAHRDVLVN